LDGLSELPLALNWRALSPSKPPNRDKSKNFPNEGRSCLAVVAVHELSWPYHQRTETPRHGHRTRQGREVDPKTLLKLPTRLHPAFKISFSLK
jgi:hypothetical protein